jgi:hypothetical protein
MYFREVLIDLDSTAIELPVNLRVQVRIDTTDNTDKSPQIAREERTPESQRTQKRTQK